jgi:DNA-binding CsgD family transcriptional regulator
LNPYLSSCYQPESVGVSDRTEPAGAYDPAQRDRPESRGLIGRVRTRAIGVQPKRTKPNRDRFLIRPHALAGSPQELLFAGLCILVLSAVFVAEILTPDVVVGAFALMPLLAAMWVLSSRPAAVVATVATLFFGAAVAAESGNRTTEILLGVAVLTTALTARLYATGLASVLSSGRQTRLTIESSIRRATPKGSDESLYGLESLTRRELEVARLAAHGYTAAEIARRLNIGDRTVESHLASAYSKLRIRSRLELIRMGSRLDPPL